MGQQQSEMWGKARKGPFCINIFKTTVEDWYFGKEMYTSVANECHGWSDTLHL